MVPERVLFDHRSSMKTESEIRQKEKRRRATERDALKVAEGVVAARVSLDHPSGSTASTSCRRVCEGLSV